MKWKGSVLSPMLTLISLLGSAPSMMDHQGSALGDTSVATDVEVRKAIFVAATVAIIMCTATMNPRMT
eukprot:5879172-Amphidinium_carterae.1